MIERDRCWYCGVKLVWQSDQDLSDVTGDEDDEGIVTHLTCSNCGAEVEYVKDFRKDDENESTLH